MRIEGKHRVIFINMLIAVAICLVVNFSHFIFSLQGLPPHKEGFMVQNPQLLLWLQVFYWFVLSFILLSISTQLGRSGAKGHFASKILYCVVVTALAYLFAPTTNREGEILVMASAHRIFSPMMLLKCSFTLIVTVLYGKIYELLYRQQNMAIENEQLRSENLLTRYNMLVSQINPHFFFNSLNSLSMLVRAKHNERALTYIDRLSDTFRYIIQKGQNDLTTLDGELEFLAGYKYLNEVRYADKLFIDIEVEERYREWLLPALSLQPLIENAVKHNSITHSKP
ncbi:MAG: histidine kinase, partial [Rikenellaceae bacterium]|nr:histidine kinase [Rikenellaceae bacterium]